MHAAWLGGADIQGGNSGRDAVDLENDRIIARFFKTKRVEVHNQVGCHRRVREIAMLQSGVDARQNRIAGRIPEEKPDHAFLTVGAIVSEAQCKCAVGVDKGEFIRHDTVECAEYVQFTVRIVCSVAQDENFSDHANLPADKDASFRMPKISIFHMSV